MRLKVQPSMVQRFRTETSSAVARPAVMGSGLSGATVLIGRHIQGADRRVPNL